MATGNGGCLSLMDAGTIKEPVAGFANGTRKEGRKRRDHPF